MPILNQSDFDSKFGKTFERSRSTFFLSCNPACSPSSFVPLISNFRAYKKKYVAGDVIAGFTVAAFNVPQGMAYAALASLPPVVGLVMGFVSPLFYCIFGTSRHISVATFAPVSMMVGFAIDNIAIATDQISFAGKANSSSPSQIIDEEVIAVKLQLASIVSFFVGVFLLMLGIFKFGFLGSYFSGSLVQGFTFGVAFHVATSQVIKVLGLKLDKYVDIGCLILTWRDIFINIHQTNVCSLTVGLATGFVLYFIVLLNEHFKSHLRVPIPAELLCVAISIVISHFCELHRRFQLQVVGKVPTGFPKPSAVFFETPALQQNFSMILNNAIPIGLISFAITLALAKLLAQRHGYTVTNNQELVALGFVNIGSSFFGCFPSAASPSRSQLQSQVGGNTQLASVFGSLMLLCVLLFAGPLFNSLPFSVLGAIVIVALRSFFKQVLQLPQLYRCDKYDFCCWVFTAALTVCMNITYGLMLGIGFCLFTVLWRSQNPECGEVGNIKGTNKFRDVRRYTAVEKIPQVLIFRFNMSLYFANAEKFLICAKQFISSRMDECKEENDVLKWMIVDGIGFNFMDHSGINVMKNLSVHCKSRDIKLVLANCRFEILMKFNQEKLTDLLDADSFFPGTEDAICYISSLKAKTNGLPRDSNSNLRSGTHLDSENGETGHDDVEHDARISSRESVEMQDREIISSSLQSDKKDQDSCV